MPAFLSPFMNTEYDTPTCRHAASSACDGGTRRPPPAARFPWLSGRACAGRRSNPSPSSGPSCAAGASSLRLLRVASVSLLLRLSEIGDEDLEHGLVRLRDHLVLAGVAPPLRMLVL